MIKDRPCGVCVALVPVDIGCSHWRPSKHIERNLPAKRERDILRKRAQRAAAREARA